MPALRALDYETVTLPTTLLAAHPARRLPRPMGRLFRPVARWKRRGRMVEVADWLIAAGALDSCRAILG